MRTTCPIGPATLAIAPRDFEAHGWGHIRDTLKQHGIPECSSGNHGSETLREQICRQLVQITKRGSLPGLPQCMPPSRERPSPWWPPASGSRRAPCTSAPSGCSWRRRPRLELQKQFLLRSERTPKRWARLQM